MAFTSRIETYKVFTNSDGLSSNEVTALFQDSRGYLWIGTANGLNRYDGNKFTQFYADDGLAHNYVTCVYEDGNGIFWIGTPDGLSAYNSSTDTWKSYRHESTNLSSIGSNRIQMIKQQNDSLIWITHRNGISKLNKSTGRFSNYALHSLKNRPDYYFSLYIDDNDILLNSSGGGFLQFDAVKNAFIPIVKNALWDQEHLDNTPKIVAVNQKEILFESVLSVYRYDRESEDFSAIAGNFSDNFLGDAWQRYFDNEEELLIVSNEFVTEYDRHGGMLRIMHMNNELGKMLRYADKGAVLKDKSGIIWIGFDEGLVKLDTRKFGEFMVLDTKHDFGSRYTRSLLAEKSGNISVGLVNGPVCRITNFKGAVESESEFQMEKIFLENSLPEEVLRTCCIYQLRNHDLIYSGYFKEPTVWNVEYDKMYTYSNYYDVEDGLINDSNLECWDMLEEQNGTLWHLTNDGKIFRNSEKYGSQFFSGAMGPDNPMVFLWSIFQDVHNDIWIGGTQGLYKVLDKDSAVISLEKYLQDVPDHIQIDVWSIAQPDRDHLWVGTINYGLYCLNTLTGSYKRYSKDNGLNSNTVCAIELDKRNQLWLSTDKGISKFDPNVGRFTHYALENGVPVTSFNYKSSTQTEEGWMLFGSRDGIVYFHPDSIKENIPFNASLSIASFKVLDQPRNAYFSNSSTIELAHNENFFTFEFTLADYTNSDKNVFEYYLEGFDKKWRSTTGQNPYAVYTGVPPGDYTFRARGYNSLQTPSENELSFAVNINPRFVQTIYFKLLIGFIVLTIAGLIVYQILRQVVLRKKMLQSKIDALRSQMNPHFFYNALNAIQSFNAETNNIEAITYLSKFSSLTRKTLENTQQELIVLEEEIVSLRLYLELEKLRFDKAFEFAILIDENIAQDELKVPPMMIQPHIENAIWHGLTPKTDGAGELIITFEIKRSALACTIDDNGIGREAAAKIRDKKRKIHQSMGLKNLYERIEVFNKLHKKKMKLQVFDKHKQISGSSGTKVILTFPLLTNNV